jgi:RNA polymerase sigma factor (sigma-70 family)
MEFAHALAGDPALLRDAAGQTPPAETAARAVSFERLVADEQAYVVRLVHRLLGYRGDVDDLVQDVFVAALSGWSKFRGESSARTWITQIALNRCRLYHRRRLLGRGLIEKLRERMLSQVVQHSRTASESNESHEVVRNSLGKLWPRDREVLVLYYLQELSVAEIATLTGTSHNAVEVRLSRARQRLKTVLKKL